MESTNTIIDLITESVKNNNLNIDYLTEILKLNGIRMQKIGNSGRPTKIARDMAITMAYMWRRKFFNEKSEQATEWILSNWPNDGLSDPSHVRSKIKAVKDRYKFKLIVNIIYDGAVVDLGLDATPSDRVPIPKESPILKLQKENRVSFLYRATPVDKNDPNIFLWFPDKKEAVIEETIEFDVSEFDFCDDDGDEIATYSVSDNRSDEFIKEFKTDSLDELVKFFDVDSDKANRQ